MYQMYQHIDQLESMAQRARDVLTIKSGHRDYQMLAIQSIRCAPEISRKPKQISRSLIVFATSQPKSSQLSEMRNSRCENKIQGKQAEVSDSQQPPGKDRTGAAAKTVQSVLAPHSRSIKMSISPKRAK